MEFCKCGGLIVPVKAKGSVKLACYVCGQEKKASKLVVSEKAKGEEAVKAADKTIESRPTVKVECPHCGNDEAFFRTEQTRATDEPETQFYTCTKCGKTWREYD